MLLRLACNSFIVIFKWIKLFKFVLIDVLYIGKYSNLKFFGVLNNFLECEWVLRLKVWELMWYMICSVLFVSIFYGNLVDRLPLLFFSLKTWILSILVFSNVFGTVPVGASAQTQPASSSVPAPFGGTCFWYIYTGFYKEP